MPTLSTNPRVLKLAVNDVQCLQKTSNAKTWLICRPSADWPEVKLSCSQRCSCNEWGLKHPGSAQTCRPLEQLSPGFGCLPNHWKVETPANPLLLWCFQGFVNQTCWDVWSTLAFLSCLWPRLWSQLCFVGLGCGISSWSLEAFLSWEPLLPLHRQEAVDERLL